MQAAVFDDIPDREEAVMKRKTKVLIGASGLAVALGLSPMVFAQDNSVPSGPIPMGDLSNSAAQPSDSVLMQKIRNALATDPSTSGAGIHVAAKDGMVTLKGEVDSSATKEHAQQVVSQIDGVKSVDNELKTRS
jgi:osmotically-inducible protein OsmY